jgi:hypothetical protein
MHVGIIKLMQRKCTTHIYIMIIKNTCYAPRLALGRRKVSSVSHGRLLELLWHEDLLLVLFDDLLVV